jgi:pre-rRNA-processing protein TSR3
MVPEPPPTVIVRHRRERKSKCSLEPLVGRPGLVFVSYPEGEPPPLDGYVRLALEGSPLGPADAERGLLLLDATWRLVAPMERRWAHVEPRSLPPLVTAYPRISKLAPDPGAGLASIEALYAAFVALGRPTEGLLDHYHWREAFLRMNAETLAQLAGRD